MSIIDNRGGRLDIRAYPVTGINLPGPHVIKDSDGNRVDVTGATLALYLSDRDETEGGYGADTGAWTETIAQSITDEAQGEYSISVPASHFSGKWGGEMNYMVAITYANETQPTPLHSGIVLIQEAY